MDNNKYVEIFKDLIKGQATRNDGGKKFIDSLFPTIKDTACIIAQNFGLTEVDTITLETYFQAARTEYLSVTPIDPGISHSLTKKGFQTWLTSDVKNEISWNYSAK